MTRVVCIGECMVELRAVGEDRFARSYAGDVYNTAVYLKRSLPQAQVQFVSATGDDAMSETMRRAWRSEGIDDSLAFTVVGGSPGLYLIETDEFGERRFQYWRSQSAARRWLALLKEAESSLFGADMLYLSGITLAILPAGERPDAIAMLHRLRRRVGGIAFDPNVRPKLWESPAVAAASIKAAIAECDILLPSTEDLAWLLQADEPLRQLELLREMGVQETALTLGAGGCFVADAAARMQIDSPAVDRVLDTSGAGDSFNGAYLAARLQKETPSKAAAAGLRVASRVVTHAGAIVPAAVSHP